MGTIQWQAQETREFLVSGSDDVKPFCRAAVEGKISKRRLDLEFPHGNFGNPSFSQGISAHIFSFVTGSCQQPALGWAALKSLTRMSFWEWYRETGAGTQQILGI